LERLDFVGFFVFLMLFSTGFLNRRKRKSGGKLKVIFPQKLYFVMGALSEPKISHF